MDKQRDTKKRKKIWKTNTDVNAGPPDTADLYYPLDVVGVTLNFCQLVQDKISNNKNNKNQNTITIRIRISTSKWYKDLNSECKSNWNNLVLVLCKTKFNVKKLPKKLKASQKVKILKDVFW